MAKVGRKPGTPKTGGRQPGSQNHVTSEMKLWLTEIINKNKPQFEENIKRLEPEKHVQVIEKLMAYIVPKPQNMDIKIEYLELERLLERTPEQYIERITAKLIELNTLNTNDYETKSE